jgi:hypothetical protein
MAKSNHPHVVAALRNYAEKFALEKGAANGNPPDRLTVADGEGGITSSGGTIKKDQEVDGVTKNQAPDGSNLAGAAIPGTGPDRLTVSDGEGGVNASSGTIPKDPGEAEIKADQASDGKNVKAASGRISRIREALFKANPELFSKEAQPAAAPLADAGNPSAAGGPSIQLSQDTLAKIASVVLSTDEGVQFAHDLIEKQAGEQAAREQIVEAIAAAQAYDVTEQIKEAAYGELEQRTIDIYNSMAQIGVTEADADLILKQAAAHQHDLLALEHPLLKQAYAQGMDDAALLEAADEMAGEEGVPPVDEALPMGGEELDPEEALQLIEELVAAGVISGKDVIAALSDEAETVPDAGTV